MLQRLRNTKLTTMVWFFVASAILNCSIDPVVPVSAYSAGYANCDEQESVIELLVEEVLGFKHAIADQEDYDTENGYTSSSPQTVHLFCPSQSIRFTSQTDRSSLQRYRQSDQSFLPDPVIDLLSPPPKL